MLKLTSHHLKHQASTRPKNRGELIYFTFKTDLGIVGITTSTRGLLAVTLPPRSPRKAKEPPRAESSALVSRLQAYFDGNRISFLDFDLDLGDATPFQTKVWDVTRSIPYGETRSYRWVAEQAGKPGAARAVGQALGKNPLPIIIPCHRVIASNGGLGGYSGGLAMKRRLLSLESIS